MDVVALNERLRDVFPALLKLLPPPFAVTAFPSAWSSLDPSKQSAFELSHNRYAQHCRLMLWRLNSYQYGSANAFLLDLEQLERAADSAEVKQQVVCLLDRLTVSEGEKEGQERVVKVANEAGTSVFLGSLPSVPGLQNVAFPHGEHAESDPTWLCNLSLGDQVVTIGTYKDQKEALMGYEKQRKKMSKNVASFNKLMRLSAKMEMEQCKEDARVLTEAVAQCHPRLTTMKVPGVAATTTLASNVTPRYTPRIVAKPVAGLSSPAASPRPTETAASPPRASRVLKRQKAESSSSFVAKKQNVELPASSTSSASSRSYLKLRRLIQTRMCQHLKGQDVCVLAHPNRQEQAEWIASGRLEAGKVFSLDKKKQMTFADYVYDELGHAVSACAHMFLVQSKESIDDHLKVCDAFSDKDRELGPLLDVKTARRRR